MFCGNEREQVADDLDALLLGFTAKSATPLFEACATAPPSSSGVTSSCVTVLITSGPVMNMLEVFFTMMMKSVIAGE